VRRSTARRVCPCVSYGCRSRRTTPRSREACLPVGNGTRGRGPGPPGSPQGAPRDSKASDASIAVAKPRSWNRPEPGARKGVAGQRSSLDGRHLGSSRWPSRSRERSEGDLGGPLEDSCTRERRGPRGGGDRGVRGSVRTHRGGKTTPTTVTHEGIVRPTEASCSAVQQAISPVAQARKRRTRRKLTRHGYRYEVVRWQKSVRRIARRNGGELQGEPTLRSWPRNTPHDVLTHPAAVSR